VKENELIASSVQTGAIPNAGYWIEHQGVDAVPYSSNWTEYARHTSHQTSLIVARGKCDRRRTPATTRGRARGPLRIPVRPARSGVHSHDGAGNSRESTATDCQHSRDHGDPDRSVGRCISGMQCP
jgi:hypothetical protein